MVCFTFLLISYELLRFELQMELSFENVKKKTKKRLILIFFFSLNSYPKGWKTCFTLNLSDKQAD